MSQEDAPQTAFGPRGPAGERVETLYGRYGKAIERYCRRRLRSREEAEDATQVVFLTAYRCLAEELEVRAEGAWLFKIAENVVLQRRRAIARRALVEYSVDVDRLVDWPVASPHESAPELAGLREALATMPESQRRAIVLRDWRGLSYREVASELAISPTAVEALIFRARRGLVRRLETRNRLTRKGRSLGFWIPGQALKLLVGGGGIGAKAVVGAASIAIVAATAHPVVPGGVLTAETARVVVSPASYRIASPASLGRRPGPALSGDSAPRHGSSTGAVARSAPAPPPAPDAAPGSLVPTSADPSGSAAERPADPPPGVGASSRAPSPVSAVDGTAASSQAAAEDAPARPRVAPGSNRAPRAVARSARPAPGRLGRLGALPVPPGRQASPPGHDRDAAGAPDGTPRDPACGCAAPPGNGTSLPPGHDRDADGIPAAASRQPASSVLSGGAPVAASPVDPEAGSEPEEPAAQSSHAAAAADAHAHDGKAGGKAS